MRLCIVLLLPSLIHAQLGWKIDQPHRYVILNGEYMALPVEEEAEENPSILTSLNPMNAANKLWESLPSFSFFDNHEETGSETFDPPTEFQQPQESAPAGVSVPPLSSFFSDPTVSSFGGIGDIFSSVTGLMKRNEHGARGRRSLDFLGRQKRKDESPQGPTRYLYKNLGQGSFVRYEIPIQTHQQEHEVKGQGGLSEVGYGRDAIPPSYNYNPKHRPQYTKPYYHHYHHDQGQSADETKTTEKTTVDSGVSDMEDPFPCPKVGFWIYDGMQCIATQAIPPWSCKPIDLAQSGKLVICRNKVYY